MSAEGWRSKLCMWRDDLPTVRFRPPGVESIVLTPKVLSSWTARDVFGHVTDSLPIMQAWEVRFQRQLAVDFLTGEWIRAVVAQAQEDGDNLVGAISRDEAPAAVTWTLEAVFPDGTARRLRGLALQKWEIVSQSGRTGLEEVQLVALSCETFAAEDFTDGQMILFRPTAGPFVSHSFSRGVYTGTSMENPAAKVTSFATQIIFDRNVKAVQFGLDGKAKRHAVGPWDVTGKSTLRMKQTDYVAALDEAVQAAMWWNIGTPQGEHYLRLCLPSVRAKVGDQEAVAGHIDHGIEYIGTAFRLGFLARFAARFSVLVPPPVVFYYLRPDGVSRYLRPDGVSYLTRLMANLQLSPEQDALFTAETPEEFVAALVALGLPGNLSKAAPSSDGVFLEHKALEDDALIGKSLLEA